MPEKQKSEKELIYLHDTIFQEGSTVTIVEHDTVKGKPRTITTTNTKIKLIRAAGQQKIVRDTVFLRSESSKAYKRATDTKYAYGSYTVGILFLTIIRLSDYYKNKKFILFTKKGLLG